MLKQIASEARGARASDFESSRAWFKRVTRARAKRVRALVLKRASWPYLFDHQTTLKNIAWILYDFCIFWNFEKNS